MTYRIEDQDTGRTLADGLTLREAVRMHRRMWCDGRCTWIVGGPGGLWFHRRPVFGHTVHHALVMGGYADRAGATLAHKCRCYLEVARWESGETLRDLWEDAQDYGVGHDAFEVWADEEQARATEALEELNRLGVSIDMVWAMMEREVLR